MKVANDVGPSGRKSVKDKVIIPRYNSAATCDIPKCGSCEQAKAKQRKSKQTKTKAIKDAEDAITRDKYQTGDFVSMNQYVVKNPGRLPTGYGRESDTNMYHGTHYFVTLPPSTSTSETKCLWELERQQVRRENLKSGFMKRLEWM